MAEMRDKDYQTNRLHVTLLIVESFAKFVGNKFAHRKVMKKL